MNRMTPTLKIGAFSRLSRVTIKALRHYDQIGLFRPAAVDPRSGYRLYCASQIQALKRIRLLSELGCTLTEIRELTAMPPESAEYQQRLAAVRRRLMLRIALAESRLIQLDRLLCGWGNSALPRDYSPVERTVAPARMLTRRDRVRFNGTDIERMFDEAEREAERLGARTPQSPILLLHDMEYGTTHADVEACVPISTQAMTARGSRWVEGADRAVCVKFEGAYSQAPLLYETTLRQMTGNGVRLAGAPIREVYQRFGAEQRGYTLPAETLAQAEADYRTELQIPVTNT